MAFLVSPGVQVVEKDLTNIIPQVAASIGGFAGVFEWGPALEATTVSSEADLIKQFGYPKVSTNAGTHSRDDWFAAANFLSYSNNLQLVRVLPDGATNAASEATVVAGSTAADSEFETAAQIKNLDDFLVEETTLTNGSVYARYPGSRGNGIGVMLVDAGVVDSDFNNTVVLGTATTLSDIFDDLPSTSVWGENFGDIKDEIHVVVYTTDTSITGNAEEVLEVYPYLSKAKNAKTADGAVNYYVDVVNSSSSYIYIRNEETAATSAVTGTGLAFGASLTGTQTQTFNTLVPSDALVAGIRDYELAGGADGATVSDANYTAAYDILNDVETVDVSLLLTGKRSKDVQKHVVEIAIARKDCIAFVSPDYASAVSAPTAAKVVDYFNNASTGFNSTSYAVFDSAWKRQYDRYNDEYFWCPLNPDTAGLVARTEQTNDAWWSPAGLNRGFIKNVVKLSFNPNQADRDTLYTKRVNPVVTFRGQGTLLYGDKTALSRPSAFDRINVRRLFIVMEKAVATAAKYQLFEFNDDLTRRVFINAIEPFLAEIKSRRGIFDFKVVCDSSNNTPEVIDQNRFVADIYVKPARSINFVTLNFVAVRSGVSFAEVAGA